jgi:hypothetical protein
MPVHIIKKQPPWFKEIEEALKRLDFMNFKEILSTAQEIKDPENPQKKAVYLDDLYGTTDEIGFVFILRESQKENAWNIDSIQFGIEIPSQKRDEGFEIISKTFHLKDGTLPAKGQIKAEVRDLALRRKYQQKLESQMEQLGFGKPVFDIHLKYGQGLADQFAKLGFTNFKTLAETASPSFYINNSEEKPPLKGTLFKDAEEGLNFSLLAIQPDGKAPWTLDSINAFTHYQTTRQENDVPLVRNYFLHEGPLPHKNQIKKDLAALVRIEEIKERFELSVDASGPRKGHGPKR